MRLVSILAPAFNCGSYIGDMIASIQSQTYSRWELIVVDDGSEDGTYGVAKRAFQNLRNDPRICLCRIDHCGYVSAFNHALSLARGEVIARQDADDLSDPYRIEKQMARLEGADVNTVVSCGMVRMKPLGRFLGNQCTGMNPRQYVSDLQPRGPCGASLVAFREVYQRVGQFSSKAEWSADSEWNFRALLLDDPPLRWIHVPEDLYLYREHLGQMSRRGRLSSGDLGLEAHTKARLLYGPRIMERLSNDGCG